MGEAQDTRQIVRGYHQRTKHHFERHAPSLGYMDWATQPDPFRRFAGADLVRLAPPEHDDTGPYEDLYASGRRPRGLGLSTLSSLFYYSLALSAWKRHGPSRWALRVNPSSGNLHPTECYLLVPAVVGLGDAPGVYHYAPHEHSLERRARFDGAAWRCLAAGLPAGAFLAALTSIPWRESWKYGERAFRYCQHDVGHALAALRLAAALLGWRLVALHHVPDSTLDRLLGLRRDDAAHADEPEVADLLVAVVPDAGAPVPSSWVPAPEAADAVAEGAWCGRANRLSSGHHPWEAIDAVERACRAEPGWAASLGPAPARAARDLARTRLAPAGSHTAGQIVRQRRSAQAMDGRTGLDRDRFYAMLARLVPALCPLPWDALGWPTFVHLGVFVHRVSGLDPGLYLLVREPAVEPALREAIGLNALWRRAPGCPEDMAFYLLSEGDARRAATRVSCDQDLAGDGAFSVGMLATFDAALARGGAPAYRHLFWETGVIGQVLYLEAEAAGVRATGIGCFYDDAVHALFGLTDTAWQSLYHLSVGGPVSDPRLRTEPAYGHLGLED